MFKRILPFAFILVAATVVSAQARDLADVKKAGTLRHLGIPYANFVTGAGDGFSVDLAKGFAAHIGVAYEFVEADWRDDYPGPDRARSDAQGKAMPFSAPKSRSAATSSPMA